MRSELKCRILKTICGDFLADFTVDMGLMNSIESEFIVDISQHSILLIPYLYNWLEKENYDVELLVILPCISCNEILETILNFIHMSSFQITNNVTGQVAHIILSKDYKQIIEEFALFNYENQTNEV